MRPPNLPVIVFLVTVGVIALFTNVHLIRSGLGGIMPMLPVAAMGVIVVARWVMGLFTLREERRKDRDLDQELKDLIDGNYL